MRSPAIAQILTVNAGSSSLKFALFESSPALRRIGGGEIERIGLPGAVIRVQGPEPAQTRSRPVAAPDHVQAASALIEWLGQRGDSGKLAAVGHRIVHGGPNYSAPQRLTPAVIDELRQLRAFDPQHLPQELGLVDALHRRFKDVPQIACFDTAFFHALPRVARLLPIPRRYAAQGVRRYGFHGLSYAFLMGELARQAGAKAARGRIILAHLGSGSSLAAVSGGKPVDTSMGFTPAAGVPMGTRSGDLDPGLVAYLARAEKMTPKQFDTMVNFQSGLLGVSETSSDMRALLAAGAQDPRAAEAIALYCYQIKKAIGGFAAALGGLDELVFAGGVGENAPDIRSRICRTLGFLGVRLDRRRNNANAAIVSTADSRVTVRVIHTDEESVIAKSVAQMLRQTRHERTIAAG